MRTSLAYPLARSQRGGVPVRLLIVVGIVGVLSAIVLPRFVELRAQANESATKASMRAVANAADEYARLHDGEYAPDAAALVLYLPGQKRLVNAFTNEPTEPSTGLPPHDAPMGSVWYIPTRDLHGVVRGYAVRGVGRSGRLSLEFTSMQ